MTAEMTDVSAQVLARSADGVYDAMMEGTRRLLDLVDLEHGGSAYVLWSELCDRWEMSEGTHVAAEACEVARAWLSIDPGSPHDVDAFFSGATEPPAAPAGS